MELQTILNNFPYDRVEVGQDSGTVYTILELLKLTYWRKGQSPREFNTYVVGELLTKEEGFTPEEYLAFNGVEYNSFRWTACDGMGCGIGLKNGVINRIIDYGGFNSGPCYDRVTILARATAQEFSSKIEPNSYSHSSKMRDVVRTILQEMGAL